MVVKSSRNMTAASEVRPPLITHCAGAHSCLVCRCLIFWASVLEEVLSAHHAGESAILRSSVRLDTCSSL